MKFLSKKNIPIILIISIAVICSIFIFAAILRVKSSSANTDKYFTKQIGVCQTLEGANKNIKYKIKFPYFKNENVDSCVMKEIYKTIDNFSKNISEKKDSNNLGAPELVADYQSFKFNNNCGASIQFSYKYKIKKSIQTETKTMVFCYGKKIEPENIFKEEKIPQIVKAIKNEIKTNKQLSKMPTFDTDAKLDKFLTNHAKPMDITKNFAIEEDHVIFSFNSGEILPNKYGTISVAVPNKALKESFKDIYYEINPKENTQKTNLDIEDKQLIALTFDDGPLDKTTPIILEALKKHNAHATFFVIGKQARAYPEIIKKEIAEGHEIGNHTFSHKTLTHLGKNEIANEIEKTNKIVKDITNVWPSLVRTPGGTQNEKIRHALNAPSIYWSIDTRDWATRKASVTAKNVIDNATDGDIVLMHDIRPSTAKAVDHILTELEKKGFAFVTVSDLFKLKNKSLIKGEFYHSCKEENKNEKNKILKTDHKNFKKTMQHIS